MELVTISVMGVLTATITAATTAYMLSGFTPDIAFAPASSFDPAMTGWFLALGVFIGLYALYYSSMMTVMQRLYNSISNPWFRNLSGGLILAVALMMFPALYGEGYTVITSLLSLTTRRHSSRGDAPIGRNADGADRCSGTHRSHKDFRHFGLQQCGRSGKRFRSDALCRSGRWITVRQSCKDRDGRGTA